MDNFCRYFPLPYDFILEGVCVRGEGKEGVEIGDLGMRGEVLVSVKAITLVTPKF